MPLHSSTIEINKQSLHQMYAKIKDIINNFPEGIPTELVSEYAEKYRILPNDTPFPGQWDNRRTPYLVEPMNNMGVTSPIQEEIFVKPAQIGGTAGLIENAIAYYLQYAPGPMLYITATEELLRIWDEKRLIPMLISCKLDHLIGKQELNKKLGSKRSGDTIFSKSFPGGFLNMGTGNSGASLRSTTYQRVFADEVSKYPMLLVREGDPLGLITARTKDYGLRRKILYISTPIEMGLCKISDLFDTGDQRYYFVRCPLCNNEIVLEFSKEFAPYHKSKDLLHKDFGFQWEMNGRQLKPNSVKYQCVECQGLFDESHKYKMMQVENAQWKPTATSISRFRVSRRINSFYSLMETWESCVEEWLKTENDPIRRAAYVNNYLAIASRPMESKPRLHKLSTIRGDYKEGTIPNGVLFLTASIDVQQGSEKDKKNPPRLELEVCGHGRGKKTWGITYRKFLGSVTHPFKGAWASFYEYLQETMFKYYRFDSRAFSPVLILIDAKDGNTQGTVFSFCSRLKNCFPVTGFGALKKTSQSKAHSSIETDEVSQKNIDLFRTVRSSDSIVYQISTNHYKLECYNALNVKRKLDIDYQDFRFCDFPREYSDEYFEGLTAEDVLIDDTFIHDKKIRNEPLDLRVYNLAASDIFLTELVIKIRKDMMKKGLNVKDAENMINKRSVLLRLEQDTAVKKG